MNNDLISRSALKEEIERNFDMQDLYLPCHFFDFINNAPTVTPDMAQVLAYESGKSSERIKGKWIDVYITHIAYECSNCHRQMPITDYFNFCPNCGSDNREADNDD